MSFDSAKAVHIHTHGSRTIDTAVVGLAEEENLLIHACGFTASRTKIRETTPEGELIFRADFDPVLSWNIRATVLAWTGLADAHPGPLARQALLFANGARYPHQFRREAEGEEVGILFYEDPSTDHEGGDTPEISFRIALEFSDLDTTNHAGAETITPQPSGWSGWTFTVPGFTPETPVPSEWAEIPVQTPALFAAGIMEDTIEDIFHGTENLDGDFTATLYDGDPATTGVAISDPLVLAVWTSQSEPDAAETTVTRNHSAVDWPATAAERTCTHIRWHRGAAIMATKALVAPLTIPAFKGVRAPSGTLALQLTWPLAGDMAASSVESPARFVTRYIFGGTTLNLPETTLAVQFYDGDPHTIGTVVGDTNLTLARSGAGWTLSPGMVESAAGVSGVATAPPGGWSISHAVAFIDDVQTWFIVQEFSPPLSIASGGTISIAAGDLTVEPG